MNIPEKGFYIHYKHDPNGVPYNYMYEVIGIGRNTEEKTLTVLYRPLYKNNWMTPADYQSRPLDMFMENIEKEGLAIPRFSRVTDPSLLHELQIVKIELYG
jgi:hypothetical protein